MNAISTRRRPRWPHGAGCFLAASLAACGTGEEQSAAPVVLPGPGSGGPVLDPGRTAPPASNPAFDDFGGGTGSSVGAGVGAASGCTTTLSGTTLDPAGALPL